MINRLVASQLIGLLGSSITKFALGVWIYAQTGSVSNFAIYMLSVQVPAILLGPFLGVAIDRSKKKWLLVGCDGISLLANLFVFSFFLAGKLSLTVIIFGSIVASLVETVQWTALSKSVVSMVDKKRLLTMNGIIESGRAISSIGAPALGGLLYAYAGLNAAFLVEFIALAISSFFLFSITIPEENLKEARRPMHIELLAGLRFLKKDQLLWGMLVLFCLMNAFTALSNTLFTPFVLQKTDPQTSGLVLGTLGVGMLVAGMVFAHLRVRRLVVTVFLSSTFLGVSLALIGLSSGVVALCLGFFTIGFMISFSNSASQSIWQMATPVNVQGKVFTLRRSAAGASAPLGTLLAIPASDFVNANLSSTYLVSTFGYLGSTLFFSGVLFTFAMCLLSFVYKRFFSREVHEPLQETEV